ncbi:MAG TPA: DinB family protein [Gemmatimonadales bacterium]
MTTTKSDTLRDLLAGILDWEDAHASFDTAVANLPESMRGHQPEGLPYSPWQLVEHLRIAQHDILDFCVNPEYQAMKWPDEYWPRSRGPANGKAWEESIAQFRKDRQALQRLARDRSVDLEASIPHGKGQTYLRELLLAADHAAYHIGQLIAVRRLLGAWSD